ncbi:aminotransferase class V-fold PLP-dependent enzyme [Flavobacteriaceae bacterium]|nr:aminotransferase class V-fold PLP-dependent enzyme [Flavobacteriaceae bacterium]MDA8935052.1 aminotransferase class V-fold PLP-dependent enzyme [Flavobacteriaceae bacterium]MDA9041712.1 aminotransferase class V-fold PLP-dependent enzyme [Flavobacteriaceae bacterium]MDA9083910.1 aminotransferase class V-fold PLP-dependent enzyme [Flavobacteriaceae bacterium]MDA9276079.1 aminotransferase class V-fold PLP-dependent enzyme [Flavobacteriaceae bacterium]
MDKRNFIKTLGALSVSSLVSASELTKIKSVSHSLPKTRSDEELWATIRSHYTLKDDYINLESGYYSIIPNPVLEHFIKHVRHVNIEGSYYMRNDLKKNKDRVISELADLVGSTSDQIAITRNTTESLDLVISGFQWEKGDEAIYAKQDYGSMKEMFEQISSRYGVKNKIVSVPNHPKNDEEIVSIYESQITDKTKLIMVCHMINITGQILPIKKICEMAHSYGVEVMVDGAHCVGHFDFSIDEFNCDYYGSSLHKWLATPLGAGLLYVNRNNTHKIWPLLANGNTNKNDIKRLNHIGTHPVHTDLAISNSIDYTNWIGMKKKEKRMRYLQRYWSDKLRSIENVIVNTPEDLDRSCGIGNVGLSNMSPSAMSKVLFEKYKIFTVAIDYANVKGCRISPNIFTTTYELDQFVIAVKEMANS